MTAALLTDAERFPFDDEDRDALTAEGVELRELEGHDPEAIVAQAADAIFVYHARFGAETIARLGGVSVLARGGAGYDNIDVAAARARGIEVVYVPDASTDEVADHALALLLACARKVALADRAVRAGGWPAYGDLAPLHRLRGRTLGLYGYGRIGRALGERAAALGLRVLAHDPHASEATASFEELLRESDFLSVHVPLTERTRHAIGAPELALMKPGAMLVNTARGPVVDTIALAAALQEGWLGGAGIDVYEEAPLPPDHPLRECETAVLTPHSAAFSEEALAEIRKRALADALRVLRGERPRNPVPS